MNGTLIASTASKARKLSDEEIHEIEHEMELYPDKQAVGLEALKIVQTCLVFLAQLKMVD